MQDDLEINLHGIWDSLLLKTYYKMTSDRFHTQWLVNKIIHRFINF